MEERNIIKWSEYSEYTELTIPSGEIWMSESELVDLFGLNSDQGSQYTTKAWEELLVKYDIKMSMDGRGRCKDNIWIERFWRTIKQEYIYLNPAETVGELRSGIGDFIKFYNYKRPHQSLDKLLPAVKYGIVA